jgi:hydrogenase maturation protease
MEMKTVVLCLGNPILRDDGVGLHIAGKLRTKVNKAGVTICEASAGGIRILDFLVGYDSAIIVDAIQTREKKPGHIYRFTQANLRETNHSCSMHDMGLTTAIELGKAVGMSVPARISIFAIEAGDVSTFSETCTPAVNRAATRCIKLILNELEAFSGSDCSLPNTN